MGVDVNFATLPGSFWSGETAMHVCARRSFHGMMKILIDGGANVSPQNDKGETPMCLVDGGTSVKGQRAKCREMLVQAMGVGDDVASINTTAAASSMQK